jgi:aspartate kinase
MQSRAIEFAKKFDVPLMVRNSTTDHEGTWILSEAAWMQGVPVCGVALVRDEARVAIMDVPDRPGVSHQVFDAIGARNILLAMPTWLRMPMPTMDTLQI